MTRPDAAQGSIGHEHTSKPLDQSQALSAGPLISAFLAGAVMLLALGLRLFRLDFQSFWGDEIFALRIAAEPFDRLLPALANAEPHPPLYYGLLHLWRALAGESDFAVRMLSVLVSMLAVAAVYSLGRHLGSPKVALAAALLAAANPFQIWYAQETRMYALLVGTTACSVAVFYPALLRGGRRRWIAYTVVTALSIFSHYHALFVVLFQAIVAALWWLRVRFDPRGWLVSQAVLVLIFLPWLLFAQSIFRSWSGWMAPVDFPTMLARSFAAHTLGTSFPPGQAELATLLLGLWTCLSLALLLARRHEAGLFLALYALVPLGGAYLLGTLLGRSMFHERYLIVVSPAFYLLIAHGIGSRGWRAPLTALGTIAALVLGLLALNNHYFDWHYQKDDLRGMARYIDAHGRPGDMVIASITREWGYRRYARQPQPVYLIPPGQRAEDIGGDLSNAAAGYRRLWFLPYARSDADLAVDRWLADHAYPAEVRWFNTLRVVLAGGDVAAIKPIDARFAEGPRLVATGLSADSAVPGDVLGVSLAWQAAEPGARELKMSLRLLDARGHVLVQSDPPLGAGFRPFQTWAPGETVRDNLGLHVPVDTPPGDYRLDLRLYDSETGKDMAVLNERGVAIGTTLPLGKVVVLRPEKPAPEAAQEVPVPDGASFGKLARLTGHALPFGNWQAGERVTVTLYWHALAPDGQDYRPVLRLVDGSGRAAAEQVVPPAGGAMPISSWRPGELVRDTHDWRLPPSLPSGEYAIRLGVQKLDGATVPTSSGAADYLLANVWVTARPGYTAPAAPQHSTDYALGDFAKLAGYDLSATSLRPGESLRLTLHWEARAETEQSYKVFTHLLAADEQVRGQDDSVPCDGGCATSGWAGGETIADPYTLPLALDAAPGTYRIEVGMYDPVDGRRLPVRDATGREIGDRIILGEVTVP